MSFPRPDLAGSLPSREERRPIVYVIALIVFTIVVTLTCFALIDVYLHYRQGINFYGYRGPAVGKKQPGEVRIAVVGGSTTWGYGLPWQQSFPAQLEGLVSQQRVQGKLGPVRVLNLGFNSEGAYSFKYTLRDYKYLEYDIVIIYSGYNDQAIEPNRAVFRANSLLFALTGYMPLLPSFMREKYERITSYIAKTSEKTVFVPPSESQLKGQRNNTIVQALNSQMDAISKSAAGSNEQGSASDCGSRWAFYCDHIKATIEFSLSRGKRVVVVTEPYIGSVYIDQQRELAAMLARRYLNHADVRYLDLGKEIDLGDPALCWDGMHLTAEGNRRIALALEKFLEI